MARKKRVNNEEDEWVQAIIDESVYSSIFEIADKDEKIQLMRDKSIIDSLVDHAVDPDKIMFVHGYKVRSDKDYWK
ncbi:MAG: hypothetical protein QXK74_08635 [Candidatus Nitrosocaldaceae archaeon]